MGFITPLYADDAEFDGSVWRIPQLFKLIMERGPNRGYFPDPAKPLLVADFSEQEEYAKREYTAEGLELNFLGGSQYLGAYLVPREELEA